MNPLDVEFTTERYMPNYLQVRNPAGELMGIMKGPFPAVALSSGFLQFVVMDSRYNGARLDWEYGYRHVTYQVKEYWAKVSKSRIDIFRCLEVPYNDLDIYSVKHFRWTTKVVGPCTCSNAVRDRGMWRANCKAAPLHEVVRNTINRPPPRRADEEDGYRAAGGVTSTGSEATGSDPVSS